MAARTIAHPLDRLVTILIAPLMTCSTRLPVYVLLIAALVPATTVWGGIGLQGLVMLGLYATGIIGALVVAGLL
jgi:ferrous iron transport protein B